MDKAWSNLVYSNNDHGRVYLNCKFHDLRGRGSCAGAWLYSENVIFLLLFVSAKDINQTTAGISAIYTSFK